MPETNNLHDLFRSEEDFEEIISEMDNHRSQHELISAVDEIGKEIAGDSECVDVEELDYLMLGWMKIAWEAHNEFPMRGDRLIP